MPKDACYKKVKARYRVFPSAYASGAIAKCRKVGAANYGKSTKKKATGGVVKMKNGGEAKAGPKQFSKKTKKTKYSTISAMPKDQQGGLGALLDKFGLKSNLHRLMGHDKSRPNKGMMIGAEAYGKNENVIKKNKGGFIARGCGQVENSRRKRTRTF